MRTLSKDIMMICKGWYPKNKYRRTRLTVLLPTRRMMYQYLAAGQQELRAVKTVEISSVWK